MLGEGWSIGGIYVHHGMVALRTSACVRQTLAGRAGIVMRRHRARSFGHLGPLKYEKTFSDSTCGIPNTAETAHSEASAVSLAEN